MDNVHSFFEKLDELESRRSELAEFSKSEYVLDSLVKRGIVPRPQNISAVCSLVKNSSKSEGYPLFTVTINNCSGKEAVLFIEYSLSGKSYRKMLLAITGRSRKIVKLDRSQYSEYDGYAVECKVGIFDEYARPLSKCENNMVFVGETVEDPLIANVVLESSLKVPLEGLCKVATVDASSRQGEIQYTSSVKIDGKTVDTASYIATPAGNRADICIQRGVLVGKTEHPFSVLVEYQGKTISEMSGILKLSFEEVDGGNDSKNVPDGSGNSSGDEGSDSLVPDKGSTDPRNPDTVFSPIPVVVMSDFKNNIDVHDVGTDRLVHLGNITFDNKSDSAQSLTVMVSMGGKLLYQNKFHANIGKSHTTVNVAPDMLYNDTAFRAMVKTQVFDVSSMVLYEAYNTLNIRSKFDVGLDSSTFDRRVVEFINPFSKPISRMVDDKSSPLHKKLSSKSITGYQSKERIIPQMEAVYEAIRDMGLKYVSDTGTLMEKGKSFQKIRTPEKVLEDRTGNCIELSILFASIFEAMCFEPIVVTTTTHAMVGIVTDTDMYHSSAVSPGSPKEIKFNDKGHTLKAICMESTLCPYSQSKLNDSIDSATETMNKALKDDHLSVCAITQYRLEKKINPIMM